MLQGKDAETGIKLRERLWDLVGYLLKSVHVRVDHPFYLPPAVYKASHSYSPLASHISQTVAQEAEGLFRQIDGSERLDSYMHLLFHHMHQYSPAERTPHMLRFLARYRTIAQYSAQSLEAAVKFFRLVYHGRTMRDADIPRLHGVFAFEQMLHSANVLLAARADGFYSRIEARQYTFHSRAHGHEDEYPMRRNLQPWQPATHA